MFVFSGETPGKRQDKCLRRSRARALTSFSFPPDETTPMDPPLPLAAVHGSAWFQRYLLAFFLRLTCFGSRMVWPARSESVQDEELGWKRKGDAPAFPQPVPAQTTKNSLTNAASILHRSSLPPQLPDSSFLFHCASRFKSANESFGHENEGVG